MYASEMTESMQKAISETNRRRKLQMEFNLKHNIIPKTIVKDIREIIEATKEIKETKSTYKGDIKKLIKKLTDEMFDAAKRLQFERAAILRDKIQELEEESNWETAYILKEQKNTIWKI